jgi:hypothetical protein
LGVVDCINEVVGLVWGELRALMEMGKFDETKEMGSSVLLGAKDVTEQIQNKESQQVAKTRGFILSYLGIEASFRGRKGREERREACTMILYRCTYLKS